MSSPQLAFNDELIFVYPYTLFQLQSLWITWVTMESVYQINFRTPYLPAAYKKFRSDDTFFLQTLVKYTETMHVSTTLN